ncbi:hypothetical protein D1BOALGB6SA_3801 [Olavius sp. associated proteobacterium Delta 1]|nr:hypothetical protein D1BOALGB6SA_3801 [Olavius sp. associated proteobacterium Delta 1]
MSQSSYLRVCKSCGADFAKSVKACPHCGKKIQSGMPLILIIGIGCLALVATLAIPIKSVQSDDMKMIATATVDQVNAAELATVLNNKKSHNDPIAQNRVKEVTGKIVQWDLEVFVCTKSADVYLTVTKPTAGAPGTLLKVYPLNDQQKKYLATIKAGNRITVKGKISGIQQGRIKIDPALII